MSGFDRFFLMNAEDAARYAAEVLHLFESGEDLRCREIGDGNINYVFRIESEASGRSVIIKQADRLLRSSGRPLDVRRSKIEARALQLESALAPGLVPEIYHCDEIMAVIAMEDISDYRNLRSELAENRIYPHLAEQISSFLADTLLPSTELVLDRREKKERVCFFTNPELCEITEDLVLTEPYDNYKNRNIVTPGNEAFVEEALYRDETLKAEVGKLRCAFMNNAQALLHGDLHTGSIFANEQGVKIIDPEFAFYGPMGYDIGNVIGNLFFSRGNKAFTAPDDTEPAAALDRTICELYDKTREKLSGKYNELVEFSLYRSGQFKSFYLDGVMADAIGYAGTELIRRVVGDSKVSELTSVQDPALRLPLERTLIRLGSFLVKNRGRICSGAELTEAFRHILTEGESL
ncbi:S-methyl-5-thioribose kinase [Oscillibacter sp.]|uniref:S-methyl-5-thioribose kinase n=1 Tax=Oscillibacter sp. TaxID=1945593 RepID=UPI00289918C9|nr:S-methyl-5-thioribose kinase [Oscillibacter sp.]